MRKFKTIEDLYNTVLPALKSKIQDLHQERFVMLTENDIWEYLVSKKWSKSNDLELSTIVDDILNVDGSEISKFIKQNDYYENWGITREYED